MTRKSIAERDYKYFKKTDEYSSERRMGKLVKNKKKSKLKPYRYYTEKKALGSSNEGLILAKNRKQAEKYALGNKSKKDYIVVIEPINKTSK